MGTLFIIIVIAIVLLLYSVYTLWPGLQSSVNTLVAPGRGQVSPLAVKHPRVESQVELREGATSRLGSKAPWGLLIACERLALWVLFVAALLLRVVFLESVPNTVTADELDFSRDLMAIFTGQGTGFFGLDWTPEPAWSIYLMAGSWRLFGMTLFAERLVSAILSAIAIFPFYALTRRTVSVPAAFIATALFAAARWYLLFSRSAWNNAHIVLYMLLAAWALTLALERGRGRYWVLYGAALALLLYGYFGGRAVVIAFIIYLLVVLLQRARGAQPGGWRPVLVGGIIAVVVCAALFAPEMPTILANQGAFNTRTNAVYIFNQPLQPGQTKFSVLFGQVTATVRSFVFMDGSYSGGTMGRYKPPGQGWLDPVSALLYLGGLVLAAIRFRRFALWWCLFLIPLGLTQLLSVGTPDGARGLPAVAPMYFFAALAIDWLLRLRWFSTELARVGVLTAALLVGAFNVSSYVDWVDSPAQQAARQPAVPVEGYYTWRDFQLARLRARQGSMTAGEYDTLSPAQIAAQIFGLPIPPAH